MNIKKPLSTLSLLVIGVLSPVQAQDQMIVTMKDGGAEQTFMLADIGKVFFESENVLVKQKSASTSSIPLTSVLSIKFSDSTVTGLRTLGNDADNTLRITIAAGTINVLGWDSSRQTTAIIYSTSGTMAYANRKWNGGAISIESLPQGVYILKINNQTFKFSK